MSKNRHDWGAKKCELFQDRRGRCERCGRPLYLMKRYAARDDEVKSHVHHKVHLSEGGTNEMENLVLTCWECECKHHGHVKVRRRDADD